MKDSLHSVLFKRKSTREFSNVKIKLTKLSNILFFSAGISYKNEKSERRFYPSPGARFPLEVYILSLNSELERAYYHYYVKNHSLEKMFPFKKKDFRKISTIPWIKNAGCIIFITAYFKRSSIKYGDRGYRHILVEAGHMAQNFYLNAAEQELGICAIGAYLDDEIGELIALDATEESVIYTLVVGEK